MAEAAGHRSPGTPGGGNGAAGFAPARAALAGNPSDGYGGAVLAVTVDGLGAAAQLAAAPAAEPIELITATVARFAADHAADAAGSAIEWSTTIPRSVGLGGSSAIVIATLRALCAGHGVALDADQMAMLALQIERDDLGIAAGPQDRIVQSYGGPTFMDFASGHSVALDRGQVPPLLIAWRTSGAAHSGIVHDDLRARFERGETAIRTGMRTLSQAAHDARRGLETGNRALLCEAVDRSYDTRAAMLTLDAAHVEMIDTARAAGAAANYAGSGGAIVCVCPDDDERPAVSEALVNIGCEVLAQMP